MLGAFLAASGATTTALGQATTYVTVTDPKPNQAITIGPGSAMYTISGTIQTNWYLTGASLPYQDANGNPANLAAIQASDFKTDPTDPSKWTVSFSCGTGTFSKVKLVVNARTDGDSNGNPAQTATVEVTGLTITKQQ